MKSKKVFFIPRSKESSVTVPCLKPSKQYIPEWFKTMPNAIPDLDYKKDDFTAKRCMPFVDSLISGYTQELICDVKIKYNGVDPATKNDLILYDWSGNFRPLSTRTEEVRSRRVFPDFEGYYNAEFHWNTMWEPKTPAGYSTLYMHPANRLDLPFMTMNGIIDTDQWNISGPLPFLIKRGFEGKIPAGTPIYQVFFIKRDSWKSFQSEYDEKYYKTLEYSVRKFFHSGYKKLYWNKKQYE